MHSKEYKYNINQIVNTNNSNIKIIKQIRMGKQNVKGYLYRCLSCSLLHKITEYDLNKKIGCPVCCKDTRKIIKGVNDLWTTHPNIASLLTNKEDGFVVSYGSCQKKLFTCPNCKKTRKYTINQAVETGYVPCINCSDGFSYPEKFFAQFLKQANINYIPQYHFNNSKYRYDFFLCDYCCIVETHGIQHYEESNNFNISLIEQKKIDIEKENFALKNNIINYFQVDCRYSEMNYIKNSIMNSGLLELVKLKNNNIDWNICDVAANSNLLLQTCDLYNNGTTVDEIAEILKISTCTIRRYITKGIKNNICTKQERKSKKVAQYTIDNIFVKTWDSVNAISDYYSVSKYSIYNNLCGNKKTCHGYIFKYA